MSSVKLYLGCCSRNFGNDRNQGPRIGFKILKVKFNNCIKYDWRKTEPADFDDHSQAYIPHMDKSNGTLISLNIESNK